MKAQGTRVRLPPPPPIQHHYAYILSSLADASRHYTGYTADLQSRLNKHNAGSVAHTSDLRPWRIETVVRFLSEKKARAFEQYLKTVSGREFACPHL
jgi:putative endonuclease